MDISQQMFGQLFFPNSQTPSTSADAEVEVALIDRDDYITKYTGGTEGWAGRNCSCTFHCAGAVFYDITNIGTSGR